MLFLCYARCGTCQKAEKWLSDNNIKFDKRPIDTEKPTEKELSGWIKKSGLDIKKFFNTSGKLYKDMNLKDKLKDMSDDEKIKLLASDGLLVKRPILVTDKKEVLVGFKEAEWEEKLK
ncbi:MAG: arsenate reductase family protein [Firmicutes bacterium]|nr:arsenate reductase family protein [Bacillota bacterium]